MKPREDTQKRRVVEDELITPGIERAIAILKGELLKADITKAELNWNGTCITAVVERLEQDGMVL